MTEQQSALFIPDLDPDTDTLTAALRYARAGWYVLPVRRGSKHPGSIVGDRWQDRSSRDPKQITAWFAGTTHGIALHCGRSGAVGIDADDPEKLPNVLRPHLDSAPYQSSRPDVAGRGHYLFAMPPGRSIGNSTGRLGGAWGEIRGLNGVIIAAPSHHKDGGRYRWERTGAMPVLPAEVAELIPDASPATDAATDAQVVAFIAAHCQNTRPDVLRGLVSTLGKRFASGESRHQSIVPVLAGGMKEARLGLYPAQAAIDALKPMFLEAVAKPPVSGKQGAARNGAFAKSEFDSVLAWAVGQALGADLDEVRARVDDKMPNNDEWVNNIGAAADQPADLFDARPVLGHIRDFAQARRVSPWAVLGAAMVRAVANIPPHIVIPPLVGGYGSLNLIVSLVGPSSAGKDAAEAAERHAITYADDWDTVPVVPLGSGEGIAATYRPPGTKPDESNAVTAAIFSAAEIDTWAALAARQGSTVTAEMRKLYSGQAIGHGNAGKDTRRIVDAHSYRACVLFGVQPLRSGPLLAAADGGLPQRNVWLPAADPDAPDEAPVTPNPLRLSASSWKGGSDMTVHSGLILVAVPDTARRDIDTHRLAVLRGDRGVDPLDGHALLTRLKVAVALMALDARTGVTDEDWRLAGIVMEVSDLTRRHCQQTLVQQSRRANRARALGAAEREEIVSDRRAQRARDGIMRQLNRRRPQTRSELRRRLKGDIRDYFDAALADLLDAAEITVSSGGPDGHVVHVDLRSTRSDQPKQDEDHRSTWTSTADGSTSASHDSAAPTSEQPNPDEQTPGTASRYGHNPHVGHRQFRRPGCVCAGQPQPCYWCELAASKSPTTK